MADEGLHTTRAAIGPPFAILVAGVGLAGVGVAALAWSLPAGPALTLCGVVLLVVSVVKWRQGRDDAEAASAIAAAEAIPFAALFDETTEPRRVAAGPEPAPEDVRAAARVRDLADVDALLQPLKLRHLPLVALNMLLVVPGHHQHVRVMTELRQRRDPSTVSYVDEALEMGFEHLAYTGLDDTTIAGKYARVLNRIETADALAVLEQQSKSTNPNIADPMRSRLMRMGRFHQ